MPAISVDLTVPSTESVAVGSEVPSEAVRAPTESPLEMKVSQVPVKYGNHLSRDIRDCRLS